MLIELSVNDFCNELASQSPAPGGGSVAALSGALGAALTAMVCNLTIGKKKYVEVENEMMETLTNATEIQQKLIRLIDADTDAFNAVISAFGMPKDTDEQKAARAQAIQNATKRATETPMDVMRLSRDAMQLAGIVAVRGNQNSISDAGVSAIMLRSACEAAALNVRINLGGLNDTAFVQSTRNEMQSILDEVSDLESRIRSDVERKL
ncbi:MAG TPA: cyclodeaminase/cyclohydrolase family protein [Candidatus Kapabacteria bacterium]|nr:cyclodeaminase/cyclohydrolase family protein [Candidatus Kapabacteria bacterium]